MRISWRTAERRLSRDRRIIFRSLLICLFAGILLSTGNGVGGEIEGMSVYRADSEITRLTYSGSNWIGYPSVSDDGHLITFLEQVRDTSFVPGKTYVRRMIKIIRSDGSDARLLFADSTVHGPAPYDDAFFMVGTKPPLISGNGEKVIFSLSLSQPAGMVDRYLGVVNGDGTGFRAMEFQNEALASVEWKDEGFTSDAWARVANYAMSDDGHRIACVVKGHAGPVSKGNPGGIILFGADESTYRTLLAPTLADGRWTWTGFPRNPLTGGGWAFALSGDGQYILFGAQSSEEKTDYDLYRIEINSEIVSRVTAFHDRLFSFADISDDGNIVTFYYAGKKLMGAGTYRVTAAGGNAQFVVAPPGEGRIDYDDATGTGEMMFYNTPRGAFSIDFKQDHNTLLFGPGTRGHVRSGIEMDFPSYPSFWASTFVSDDGQTVLLTGVPVGKDLVELYVLRVSDTKKVRLYCPRCKQKMELLWQYCPYDGASLE
ncbi:MAG: hypothetical protein JRJ85_20580 [Deltaproteobacteria bacterium]|nr:hypothetical protein [Deltaproteobacteria bacterium]